MRPIDTKLFFYDENDDGSFSVYSIENESVIRTTKSEKFASTVTQIENLKSLIRNTKEYRPKMSGTLSLQPQM